MMNFPAWRCARTSARICWTRVAIVAAKAGSTQYVIPRTVASGVLGGLHSAATSGPAQRNSAASVSAGRSMLIGLPPLRPRRDERRALGPERAAERLSERRDRKSTRLNSSHSQISYAVFCLKKKSNEDLLDATTGDDARDRHSVGQPRHVGF